MNDETRKYTLIAIVEVGDNLVEDMPGNGKPSEDAEAGDRLEEEVKSTMGCLGMQPTLRILPVQD